VYILLDGFDLGVGILATRETFRSPVLTAIALLWDLNETCWC
jgi:cytochrome bd-type quinol oxidase subunit 2